MGTSDGIIRVNVHSVSACHSCHAKGACSLSESEVKTVEVSVTDQTRDVAVGETVDVILQPSQGIRAVLFGYVLPFVLVLATLMAMMHWTANELASGVTSVLILVPYYLLLRCFRSYMKKVFVITIEKL